MCGISGILDATGASTPAELAEAAARMANALAHRGPDGHGAYADPAGHLALGHRRLAILDLSPQGGQPMRSHCGRFVLCYNGEIYNHAELRSQIEAARAYSGRSAISWRGHSDSEILLEALALWGPEEALARAAGMFALALWDVRERTLTLARDRLGEKPLYYALRQGRLFFASELPGLTAAPGFGARVDRAALALFLRLSCVPAPHSILEGVRKLPAAHLLSVRLADAARGDLPAPRPWWSLSGAVEAGLARPFGGTEAEAQDALLGLLRQSVRGQMVADVPLGALLSGGIDSSLIAALMAEQASSGPAGRVRTFTIGYSDAAYDESAQAEAVARHLGCEHTTLVAGPRDALELVPRLAQISGEPFADASLLPTRLVAELTRGHVTVCLSGDGGDELFAGYNRHVHAPRLWERLSGLSVGLRSVAAGLLQSLAPRAWDRAFRAAGRVLPARARQRLPGEKLHKLAMALPARVPTAFYAALVSAWPDPGLLVPGASEASWALRQPGSWPAAHLCPQGGLSWLQYLDAAWYLPEDILTKVDRAAMSVGLEARAPYLDHRVAEFAWSLPVGMRVRAGQGKLALRGLLGRYLPPELWERPKMGFGVPLDAWLRGELKDWAVGLLDPVRLRREGYFQPEPVAGAWAEHQSGRFNRQYRLWPLLMFQSWLESAGISE
ncbi:MAG: asparagine synthase (glutamine-hydrolyzing) [Proteobacteria bacterium]|nr:asparagine synthase (glutamine-hydrolyzing) [Pseudomonadota bacterium]MBU1596357.1 asparagine synthase (glutamine-hydrolyzing) [Pseudomonadota bacterium]